MGGLLCLHRAAEWRVTAVLGLIAALAAAPAAVRCEQVTMTVLHRGAPVEVTRTLLQGQPVATSARSSASAQRASPARITASLSERAEQHETATPGMAFISLSGCPTAGYNVPLKLKHGGTVTLSFDTGSADLAVVSTGCGASCAGIVRAFPFDSPGNTGRRGHLDYGTATLGQSSISGEIFSEQIQLQGLPAVGVHMLAITSQTDFFVKVACRVGAQGYIPEGIIGFGPDETSKFGQASIMGTLANVGLPKIFAPALCPEGGRLYVGGYDSSAIQTAPYSTPLYADGDYEQPDGEPLYAGYLIHVDSIAIAGQGLGLDAANSWWLADTGTNGLSLPPRVATNAAALLDGPMESLTGVPGFFDDADYCTFAIDLTPAQLSAALPTLDFSFTWQEGGVFTVHFAAANYLQYFRYANGTYQYCPFAKSKAADLEGANILPDNMMVRELQSALAVASRTLQRLSASRP